ncbi:MAG: transcription elongation factor GreB [Bdellovibrionales bacterium RIFOXYA1_FULL_36_14]|nr:MAG: transcription elongation factor GreB [Bdellovibrionales bacterium RIFOXYA1_FULL_36_14]
MNLKEKNYITVMGLKKLEDELNWYMHIERPKICNVVSWAAALGDRSENADYIYGKKRLREIDSKIRFLSKQIESAEVIDPEKIKSETIQFGATVKVVDENGQNKTFAIVGMNETDAGKNFISWKSPIGRALLGKCVGDDVVVTTPRGEIKYIILEISYILLDIGEFNVN